MAYGDDSSGVVQLALFVREKRCCHCREIKPVEAFGNHAWCKECLRRYMRERYRRQHPAGPPKPALAADEKRCSSCKQVKQRTEFGRSRHEKDGLNWVCKVCIRRQSVERYRRHHPAARAVVITATQRAQWRAQGLKRCAKCEQVLSLEEFGPWSYSWDGLHFYCRLCISQQNWERYHADIRASRERARKEYWADPEKFRARKREANRARPDRLRLRNATMYLKHRTQRRAYARVYRLLNKEAVDAYHREWQRRNPVKVRAKRHRREALERNAPGTWTAQDIALIYQAQRGRCAYCLGALGLAWHVEHMAPLARGGSNWPWNLCLACVPCNSHKHTLCAGAFLALLAKERRAGQKRQAAV